MPMRHEVIRKALNIEHFVPITQGSLRFGFAIWIRTKPSRSMSESIDGTITSRTTFARKTWPSVPRSNCVSNFVRLHFDFSSHSHNIILPYQTTNVKTFLSWNNTYFGTYFRAGKKPAEILLGTAGQFPLLNISRPSAAARGVASTRR